MGIQKQSVENNVWTIVLEGRIDTTNADAVKQELLEPEDAQKVIVDCTNLQYLSSAGLRVLLHIKKKYKDTEVVNVSSEVYEILEMTGFTEMMHVEKAYRSVSIEGCQEIGRGSNGIVYRTDPETIVKVYYNKDALPDIRHEREVARRALILGIPTAISYDIVKVGDQYGSVFELLNAKSISEMLIDDPEKNMDECIGRFVGMLKDIHAIEAPEGTFPRAKATAIHWAEYLASYLPSETYEKLIHLISSVPEDNHLVHGDYHSNNVLVQNGETLLIDMDTLSQGNPIFELASMYLAYCGYAMFDPQVSMDFYGFDSDVAHRFWKRTLSAYLNTDDEAVMKDVQDRACVIGYARLMRRTIKRIGIDTPEGKQLTDYCREQLIALCDTYESLV